jgi:uncharacterized protein (DUF1778 family)
MVMKKSKKTCPRVAIRFTTEADYAAVHHAAKDERLSMNAWMVKVLLEAAAAGKGRRRWTRQENRNRKA